jgi:hypothetical protein
MARHAVPESAGRGWCGRLRLAELAAGPSAAGGVKGRRDGEWTWVQNVDGSKPTSVGKPIINLP